MLPCAKLNFENTCPRVVSVSGAGSRGKRRQVGRVKKHEAERKWGGEETLVARRIIGQGKLVHEDKQVKETGR